VPTSLAAGGTDLEVWVQPRASRDEIVGIQGGALKIRIAAPPVEGEANDALVRFVAKALGVARGTVTVARGQSSRRKRLRITGLDPEAVRGKLGI